MNILGVARNYSSLSVKDLLEARDLYHYHLIHKANVVGTAIGLYLIRETDPWPTSSRPDADMRTRSVAPKGERTLDNSSVRDYSWPCIIVFVDVWVDKDRFGSGKRDLHPENMVPKTLYMPDGRTVPVCVVKVTPAKAAPAHLPAAHWPQTLIGGGFPLVAITQGEKRLASIGCLVTDGHTVFALTNRHVSGPEGCPISAILRGGEVEIGRSSAKQLTRLPFTDVYRDFPGQRTWLTLDIGLVEISDLKDWTSQVYGLGSVGPLADLSERNISLRLIEAETVAYGASSGRLKGRIKALFYRHRSIGGYDDVSDFLIAPDPREPNQTQPGDSGTVWHLKMTDPNAPVRPLAVEWGGQTFLSGTREGGFNFALATSLSNVCRLLDVELVRDHNTGVKPYWGKTGHYSIAAFACDAIQSKKLETLMQANRDRIAFELSGLDPDAIEQAIKDAKEGGEFVPLADVPDIVWKQAASKIKGGRKGGINPENPTHYADIDQPRPGDGLTLRDICSADPSKVTVEDWQAYYDTLGHTKPSARGLLPFRVWQFYDAMVEALRKSDVPAFVCAAGIMAHYVGDACQTLHGSYLNNGYPDGRGDGVHGAYEDAMIDNESETLFDLIGKDLAKARDGLDLLTDGQAVAACVFNLMDRTMAALPPSSIVDAFIATGGGKSRQVTSALWEQFGETTAAAMADGARVLALVWDSAWKAGNGDRLKNKDLIAIDKAELMALYEDRNFVPSLVLNDIAAILK
ncbi:hypothetical protein DSM25558_4500 [Agrobacterium sp. DSM 25558]|uniref:S1/P1 Nuclease n=1 Tax=Agrobacterium sp. DSM 25558 TaxID=1907665 RepID=UPI0009724BC4|nr:S1/P1 Nuclease [Agrobacterium sp. DSM 25558]SCX28540.1 hypothetical protein DSM25558_4500 [Agrobacterium sp. DSM 25558]